MKTIVVGDIHGCYNELKKLIEHLVDSGKYDSKCDRLIFLGDYIDRGVDSRLVIKYIRDLQKNNENVIALMGNHEDMLLEYFENYERNCSWFYNGYETTVRSYSGYDKEFLDDVEWIEKLPLYFEDDDFIYVHAGIDVNKPMDKQDRTTLLWTRDDFIYNIKKASKRVIFGHTPTFFLNSRDVPVITAGGNIDIDTGCVYGNKLTALIINDGNIEEFCQI